MTRHSFQPFQGPALLAALALAFVARYLFTGEWFTSSLDTNGWHWPAEYSLALGCVVAAIILAGWAARAPTSIDTTLPLGTALPPAAHPVIIAVLLLAIATIGLYLMIGEHSIVQILWVAGIIIFAAGSWRTIPPARREPWSYLQIAIVAGLTLVGFGLRYWRFTEIPDHVDNDIPWVGTAALALIEHGDYRWIGYNADTPHLQSFVQFYAWSMRLFGTDQYGLLLTSVLAGTLTLPIVYLLGREQFGPRAGLVAMALLTLNYTHIHFSRTMFGPKATLFATLTIWLALRGIRRNEPAWSALAGLALGIGLLFYDSSRVLPMVALAVACWWLIRHRKQRTALLPHAGLFALGALVGFGPVLAFALSNFDLFYGRGHDVMLWSPSVWEHATATYGVSAIHEVIAIQAARAFLTFYLYGDGSPQFAFQRPMVESLTAGLLTVGFGAALTRLNDLRYISLVVWLVLTLLLGGVATYDPPFWPHLNIALPAVVLIAGVGAERIIAAWSGRAGALIRPALSLALAAAIGLTAIQSWQVYYEFVKDNAGPRNRMARYISQLPTGYRVILVSDEYTPDMFAFRFFSRGVPIEQHDPAQPIESAVSERATLYILHRHDELLAGLQAHYPGGELIRHLDRVGEAQFLTYRVPADPAPLAATVRGNQGDGWLPGLLIGLLIGWSAGIATGIRWWRARTAGGAETVAP